MTRPTDAAIARAFWYDAEGSTFMVGAPISSFVESVLRRAAEFDAESPAGTEPVRCPKCSAAVLFACVACSESNYPPPVDDSVDDADISLIEDDEPAEVTIRKIRNEWEGENPFPEKVTTSPERVQIPAESKHIQCPKCPAHMPVGQHCGGAKCPLRKP